MKNKTAFITGAATGIGMAVARKLDSEGWRVFAGVHRSSPDDLVHGASERLTVLNVNVGDDDQVRRAAAAVDDALGGDGLGLLINNAAMTGAPGPVECVKIDEFKWVMDVNFWGPLRVTQAFLPLLRRCGGARVVMVTSASVYLTIPLGCSYPVSKVALAALTRHLRIELVPLGIEVTALEPGGVRTKMTAAPPEEEERTWAAIPPALLPEYKAKLAYPMDAITAGFEFESPESYADKVYETIVMARRLKPVYTLGKGVWFLPIMHRLLSHARVEKAMRRLFKVKG